MSHDFEKRPLDRLHARHDEATEKVREAVAACAEAERTNPPGILPVALARLDRAEHMLSLVVVTMSLMHARSKLRLDRLDGGRNDDELGEEDWGLNLPDFYTDPTADPDDN